MYGSNTEVILHSLDIDNPSIIMIANNHLTGRDVGAPITDLALQKLKTNCDVSEPYFNQTEDGRLFRSVTSVIKNSQGTAIGILCINMDLNVPLNNFFMEMFPKCSPDSPEKFSKSAKGMLIEAINKISKQVRSDARIPAGNRNKRIVQRLNEDGFFNIKDATMTTAEELGITKGTVYRYIRE
ncbi:PAS domain-containing protein [Vibrio sp. Isolate31]|nr:PAS domain-containing protein [Vibrio sp. Isolate32]MCG9603377.1 PAS domain-containing protein [Vibrio sp. Isolate31]